MSENNPNNREDVEVVEETYNEDEINLDDMVELTMDQFEELMEAEGMNENEDDIEKPDDSVLTIDDHDGAIFAIDSFNNLLATGGEDDKAFIWSINSIDSKLKAEKLFEMPKFDDSVTTIKFSCDGKYLAASDMGGKIRVYLVENYELFWSYDVEMDIEKISWHPDCNVLFCSTSEGQFIMFKISTNEVKFMTNGDDTPLSCFKILKDGKQAVCCYNNGNVRIWDLKTGLTVHNILKAHEEDIICVDCSADGNLIATGGIDMKLNIMTSFNGKIVWKFTVATLKPKVETPENSEIDDNNNMVENAIESIGFCKTMPIIACATLNGELIAWDLNTHQMRHKVKYDHGFSKILWDEKDKLFSSTLDGAVIQWDGRNLEMIKKCEGHSAEILDFCMNKKHIATASNDQTVKIFEI